MSGMSCPLKGSRRVLRTVRVAISSFASFVVGRGIGAGRRGDAGIDEKGEREKGQRRDMPNEKDFRRGGSKSKQ